MRPCSGRFGLQGRLAGVQTGRATWLSLLGSFVGSDLALGVRLGPAAGTLKDFDSEKIASTEAWAGVSSGGTKPLA